MNYIEITIQNAGQKYRLGVSVPDSKFYFGFRGQKVKIIFSETRNILTQTSCGVKSFIKPLDSDDKKRRKKGYDFNTTCVDEWIKENQLNLKTNGKRKKVIFKLTYKKGLIHLIYRGTSDKFKF